MVQTPPKPMTLAEFLQLPETKPAKEYINGEIIEKPMSQGKHSVIQGELPSVINQVVKPQRIARAFPELRTTFGDRSIVPDISVFTWHRVPRDAKGEIANIFTSAPDWTIEILSPDQNILYCLAHGTQMGWLIDPDEQTVLVYLPQQQTQVYDQPEQILPVPPFASGLSLSVGLVFGWLLE